MISTVINCGIQVLVSSLHKHKLEKSDNKFTGIILPSKQGNDFQAEYFCIIFDTKVMPDSMCADGK